MIIRDFIAPDLFHGFFETLTNLADVGFDINNPESMAKACEIYRKRLTAGILTYVAVLSPSTIPGTDGELIVGTVTLLPDWKFIHEGSLVYHLEDVAVHKAYQGKHIGQDLVRYAIQQATTRGAYKIVAFCDKELTPYYEKLGFKNHDSGLRLDL